MKLLFVNKLIMRRITVSTVLSASVLLAACGGHPLSRSGDINPRDTVNVPEGLTGEDSIAYIENTVIQSPISCNDLLGLAEVHSVEGELSYYGDLDLAEEYPEEYKVTHRDSVAMRLANRFMRMGNLVYMNGNANDKLQWAVAVNVALDSFHVEVPSVPKDSVVYEIGRVVGKYSSLTQREMNFQCYVSSTIDYYCTIEAYREWIQAVPTQIKPLAQEEYEAWHDLNDARFALWRDVSYSQEWYSMKPMEIEGYYENLSKNRRAELEVEREIVLEGKPYQQKGTTVTTQEWEKWLTDNSVPEDIELLKELDLSYYIPSDSIVTDRINTLKSTFTRWLKARQAFAAALPEQQGDSYDNLTADIHSRFIGKLASIIPYDSW